MQINRSPYNALNKALKTAEDLLDDDDKLIKLKAIHALSQTSATLMKVLEIGEQEARLAAVEEALLAQEEGSA